MKSLSLPHNMIICALGIVYMFVTSTAHYHYHDLNYYLHYNFRSENMIYVKVNKGDVHTV